MIKTYRIGYNETTCFKGGTDDFVEVERIYVYEDGMHRFRVLEICQKCGKMHEKVGQSAYMFWLRFLPTIWYERIDTKEEFDSELRRMRALNKSCEDDEKQDAVEREKALASLEGMKHG